MKFRVNDGCIGCGLCEGTCPEVFAVKDSGKAEAIDSDVPAEAEASAQEAMDGCPVGAIEQID
ncbi:MAG: ferredoxin [Eubacteriales bacterium]|nr:ferredoxin [Eubacteriales bacterium]